MSINPQINGVYTPPTLPITGTATTTVNVPVAKGDYLVVTASTDTSGITLSTPTGGGLTYTLQAQSTGASGFGNQYIWTAPATTAATVAVAVATSGGGANSRWSLTIERWSNVASIGATKTGTGTSTAPSLSITTTSGTSSIVFASTDANAVDGSTRVWNTSTAGAITEDNYDRTSPFLTDYVGHYLAPGAAGAETVGLTSPATQKWSACAVELVGLSGTAQVPSTAPADTASLTDTASVVRTDFMTPADSIGVTDSVVARRGYNNTAADTTSLTDSASVVRTNVNADVTTLTDSVTVVKTVKVTVADTMSVTDDGGMGTNPNGSPNIGVLPDGTVIAVLTRADIGDYQFLFDTSPWCAFGKAQAIVVSKFDMAGSAIRAQDTPGGLQDVMIFGVDRQTPGVWTFEMTTEAGSDPATNLGWADTLAQVWDSDVRQTPTGALALRYGIAGRLRRVYGRPRRWTPVPENRAIGQGRVLITADFQLSEVNTHYDDILDQVTVGFTPSVVKGTHLQFPIIFPLALQTPGASRHEQMIIGGSQKTWITPVIHGPCSNPWVQITAAVSGATQRYALTGAVAAGDSIALSGAPWNPGVVSSQGIYHPEMLDPKARLSQLRVDPGTYTVTFGGLDASSSAICTITWRTAHRSL